MIQVGVLGPAAVLGGPAGVALSRQQRRLVAALALRPGSPTGVDTLADVVWPEALPQDPANALALLVSRLRRVVGTDAVVTAAGGYRLGVETDAAAFEREVALARDPEAAPAERADLLEAALARWRGVPFEDLDRPEATAAAARLADLRADAVELRIEALLECGRPAEAAAEAAAHVADHPLREPAVALQVRALVAAGRQTEALERLAQLRRRLADDLGVDPSAELQSLELAVLRQEPSVAPAAVPRPRPAPAPAYATLLGRDGDLARIEDEISAGARIVTLHGPGGVGKTALAGAAVERLRARFQDVVVVELAAVGSDARVLDALAAAAGVGEAAGESLPDRVAGVLHGRSLLVVLDDCDRVVAGAAATADLLASGPPGVVVLATSREPLRLAAELVVPVAPLSSAAAVALFVERARRTGWSPGEGDAAAVQEVCATLDRLPLAIELAAARVRALGARGLLAALGQRFVVLDAGLRSGPEHHRSLRAVVEWCVDQLPAERRSLLAGMAVLGAEQEAGAIAVVTGRSPTEALVGLADLAERSLVVVRSQADGSVAYDLLETVRAYGREELVRQGLLDTATARHAAWVVDAATAAAAAWNDGVADAAVRLDRLAPELRRADRALAACGAEQDRVRLALAVGVPAVVRLRVDVLRFLEETAASVDARSPAMARLLGYVSFAAWQRGDLAQAGVLAARGVEVAEAVGEPAAAAAAYDALANVAAFEGRVDAAVALARTAYELAGERDPLTRVLAAVDLATVTAYAGDFETALGWLGPAEDATAPLGPAWRAWAAYAAGEVAATRQEAADEHLRRAVDLARQGGNVLVEQLARHTLVTVAARRGEAGVLDLVSLVDSWHRLGGWTHLWLAVRGLVEALHREGRPNDALLLLTAARSVAGGPTIYGADAERLAGVEAELADAVPAAEAQAVRAQAAAMDPDAVVAHVRGLRRSVSRPVGP